jgi:hypothetical protein
MAKTKHGSGKQVAYFQTHYIVPKALSDELRAAADEQGLESFQFTALCQVIASQAIQHRHGKEVGRIAIPATAFKNYARGANRKTMEGVLKTPGIYRDGYCLRWEPETVYKEILDRYLLGSGIEFYEQYAASTKVNLFTGRRCSGGQRTQLCDESDNLLDRMWINTMRVVMNTRVVFDYDAIVEHLDYRIGIWLARLDAYGVEHVGTVRARARFDNDRHCFLAVLNQDAQPLEGSYWTYRPAYFQARTGRAFQIGGSLQSSSRRMKMKAFGKIEGVRNYDLVSSQARFAIIEFKLAGISTQWLETYCNNPNAKADFAKAARLPVKVWKNILLALLMGGYMPRHADEKFDDEGNLRSRGEVFKLLKKVAEKESRDLQEVIDTTMSIIGELVRDLAAWHDYLYYEYVPKVKRRGNKQRWFITNLVNCKLYLDELPKNEIWRAKSQIASHLLQGREANFIFTVSQLSPRFGFTVLGLEHDGLVVINDVPHEAIRLAAEASGLGDVRFEHKDFEDDPDEEEDY